MQLADIFNTFHYEPATGELFWLRNRRGPIKAGMRAGSVNADGYVVVKVWGERKMAHHIVWAIHKGAWPENELDHKNHLRSDNRIENLREATRLQNCRNMRAKGYRFETDRGKWLARICVNGKQINLGRFDTEKEAKTAYDTAAAQHFGEFANGV